MRSTDFTLRGYRLDQLLHFYRKRRLADPSIGWVLPRCEFDKAEQQWHERTYIDLRDVAQYRVCLACAGTGGVSQ